MLIYFLLFNKFHEIYNELKNNEYLNNDSNILFPGDYNFSDFSFTLNSNLFGFNNKFLHSFIITNNNIGGFLIYDEKFLNIISTNSIFADKKSQKFYKLLKLIDNKNNSYLFDIIEVNPLSVLTNLHLSTFSNENNYNCEFLDISHTSSICKSFFNYNWPNFSPEEDPFSLDPIKQRSKNNEF